MTSFIDLVKIFVLSMVPLIEQRGSIPWGIIWLKMDYILVFIVCVLGSVIPAPLILLLFNKIMDFARKRDSLKFFTNFVDKKIRKNTAKFEKSKEIALIIFIGIPLPTTGVWTGSAIAAFLGLDFKKSMVCAFLGAIISGIALTLLSLLAPNLLSVIGIHV